MRLRLIAVLLLVDAACSGADDAPAGDVGAPSEPALEATEPQTPDAEAADGTFTIVSGAAAEDDADVNADFPPDGDTVEMTPFADQSFYNSGIFDPGQTVVMPIADDAAPGTYSFVCYLHPATMEMTVEVVDPDEEVQPQSDLDTAAQEAIDADPADGSEAITAAEAADPPAGVVQVE